MLDNKNVVSVCMITYNHEKFVKQAIEGVLIQKTDFNIEFIISNDNSSDNTHQEIIEATKQLPSHINLSYHNQKKNLGMVPNFVFSLRSCTGKYIAICEGDDYWVDPYKLQKQVDFLENNSEFVLCSHNAKIVDENNILLKERKSPQLIKDKTFSKLELQKGANLLTLTLMFRNIIKSYPNQFFEVNNPDTFLISLLGAKGKGKYMESVIPAVYRSHGGGVWSNITNEKRLLASKIFNDALLDYYKGNKEVYTYYYNKQVSLSRKYFRKLKDGISFRKKIKYNRFYLKYNPIFSDSYRFKEWLKFNLYYFFKF